MYQLHYIISIRVEFCIVLTYGLLSHRLSVILYMSFYTYLSMHRTNSFPEPLELRYLHQLWIWLLCVCCSQYALISLQIPALCSAVLQFLLAPFDWIDLEGAVREIRPGNPGRLHREAPGRLQGGSKASGSLVVVRLRSFSLASVAIHFGSFKDLQRPSKTFRSSTSSRLATHRGQCSLQWVSSESVWDMPGIFSKFVSLSKLGTKTHWNLLQMIEVSWNLQGWAVELDKSSLIKVSTGWCAQSRTAARSKRAPAVLHLPCATVPCGRNAKSKLTKELLVRKNTHTYRFK